jgi:hypothetical protein
VGNHPGVAEEAAWCRLTKALQPMKTRNSKFYESDCQGHTSSSLIAFRSSSPLQSASSVSEPPRARLHGWAEQSFAAVASFVAPSVRFDDLKRLTGDHSMVSTMVLSETRGGVAASA